MSMMTRGRQTPAFSNYMSWVAKSSERARTSKKCWTVVKVYSNILSQHFHKAQELETLVKSIHCNYIL